jgi:hypothetical protein
MTKLFFVLFSLDFDALDTDNSSFNLQQYNMKKNRPIRFRNSTVMNMQLIVSSLLTMNKRTDIL